MAIPILPLPKVLMTYNDFETVLNHFVHGRWHLEVNPSPEPYGTVKITLDQYLENNKLKELKFYIIRHKMISIRTIYRYQNMKP